MVFNVCFWKTFSFFLKHKNAKTMQTNSLRLMALESQRLTHYIIYKKTGSNPIWSLPLFEKSVINRLD